MMRRRKTFNTRGSSCHLRHRGNSPSTDFWAHYFSEPTLLICFFHLLFIFTVCRAWFGSSPSSIYVSKQFFSPHGVVWWCKVRS